MALNYSDREALRPLLVPRIRNVVANYFLYVLGGGGTPSAERLAWVEANMPNIGQWAEQMSWYVMSETDFQNSGTSISDAAIQSRVEFAFQNYTDMPA